MDSPFLAPAAVLLMAWLTREALEQLLFRALAKIEGLPDGGMLEAVEIVSNFSWLTAARGGEDLENNRIFIEATFVDYGSN